MSCSLFCPRCSETHMPLNVKIRNSANPPLLEFLEYFLFKNDVFFHKMVLKIYVICADFFFPFSLFCKKTSNYFEVMSKNKKWHHFTIKWHHKINVLFLKLHILLWRIFAYRIFLPWRINILLLRKNPLFNRGEKLYLLASIDFVGTKSNYLPITFYHLVYYDFYWFYATHIAWHMWKNII